MKKTFAILLACFSVLSAATVSAQANGDTVKTGKSADPMVVKPGMPDDPMAIKPGKTNDEMSVLTDTGFISKNITDNMMEIQLSKLGQSKSSSAMVKKTAALMISDHAAILTDLKKLAAKKQMSLSKSNLPSVNSMLPMDLPGGSDFDARWASAMLTMHEAKIAELEKYIGITQDVEIKAAASKALPKIKMHRDMLAKIPGAKAAAAPNTAVQ